MTRQLVRWVTAVVLAVLYVGTPGAQRAPVGGLASPAQEPHRALVASYCLSCHNTKTKAGGLELQTINTAALSDNAATWEKVARKLRARQMPPPASKRPDDAAHAAALTSLEGALDQIAATTPNPGRTDTFRRLNGTEYRNAIRDLLALEIDPAALLPNDSSALRVRQHHGREPLADAARTLRVCSGEDQPARRRTAEPFAGRRNGAAPARPDAGGTSSTGFRSARAAAHSSVTSSRSTAITRSRSGWRATATSTSKGCSNRTRSSCCSTASACRCSVSRRSEIGGLPIASMDAGSH